MHEHWVMTLQFWPRVRSIYLLVLSQLGCGIPFQQELNVFLIELWEHPLVHLIEFIFRSQFLEQHILSLLSPQFLFIFATRYYPLREYGINSRCSRLVSTFRRSLNSLIFLMTLMTSSSFSIFWVAFSNSSRFFYINFRFLTLHRQEKRVRNQSKKEKKNGTLS